MAWVQIDDITGEAIAPGDGGTIRIAIGDSAWDIDLATSSRDHVVEEMAVLLARARPVDGTDPVPVPVPAANTDEGDDPADPPEPTAPTPGPPRVERLDEAERLLRERKTPAAVARATGLDLPEVRDLLGDLEIEARR